MADEVKKDQENGATPDELGEAGKRALDAERGARKAAEKELRELQAKVKEFEDSGKSELEKLQARVVELTKESEAATAKADRWEVAISKGLTLAQARRLVGATKEELEADADAMAEELGLKKDEGKKDEVTEGKTDEELPQDERPLSRPQENLKPGASNEADEAPDPAKLADKILSNPW